MPTTQSTSSMAHAARERPGVLGEGRCGWFGGMARCPLLPRHWGRWRGLLQYPAAFFAAFFLLMAAPAPAQPATSVTGVPQRGLREVPLVIEGRGGAHRFRVEVAATPRQQETGMMFRRDVPEGTGMLFPMRPARDISFWMKDTLVPLDIIFVGKDRRILNIAARARPLSRTPLPSAGPAAAVVELGGGEAARLGIGVGDLVRWGDGSNIGHGNIGRDSGARGE